MVNQETTHALLERLRALPSGDEAALQATVKAWRADQAAAVIARFEAGGTAAALVAELSDVMDALMKALLALMLPSTLGIAVLATGGYGRREMFPHSDVDLLFLYRPAARGAAERLARNMLYSLWDLGLKVGHALRTVDESLTLAAEDMTVRTNVLDARLVAGDCELAEEMLGRFERDLVAGTAAQFVEARLNERDARHRQFGDSRFLLEPNLKEGKGGLRDLHTLYWIARYVYGIRHIRELESLGFLTAAEVRAFARAERFLWTLRAHLHLLAGKPEERLTFDKQPALAEKMHYRGRGQTQGVERLMKHYFLTAATVGNLTRVVCAVLEEKHQRAPRLPLGARLKVALPESFTLESGWLSVPDDTLFAREPLAMLRLFYLAQQQEYDIHPRTLQAVSRHAKRVDAAFRARADACTVFMEILLSPRGPELALRRMNEAGLLGRMVPEFGRIVGQMQFNMYHIYTVDEHTIVALGNLHALEQGALAEEAPLATAAAQRMQQRHVVYLALLAHDVAKGGTSDHSEAGAALAHAIATRFGFTPAEAEETAWLVQHHLLLTHTAFKRDVQDPQTIVDFARTVQSVERLRLLLALTVADMRAVAPGVWNEWKAALLRTLVTRTEDYLRTGALKESESPPHLPVDYVALAPAGYIRALPEAAHLRVFALLQRLPMEEASLLMDAAHDEARAVTEITVVTEDQHGLFSRLAGAISLSGANIVGAKIFTLKDGTAVDCFTVQDETGAPFREKERLARMALKMRQSVAGTLDVGRELAKQKPLFAARREAFQVPGQVFIENEASSTHTVIEVVGRDRIGFLFAVTRAISEAGLTIGSAHISTYGAQAVDVFYVKDAFGHKITHPARMQQVRDVIREAIT